MVGDKIQYDKFEFDLLMQLIESREKIFLVGSDALSSDYYHFFNKGFTINYFPHITKIKCTTLYQGYLENTNHFQILF